MNKCKCGCGKLVEKNYRRGHARRGRKNTDNHNDSIRKANIGKTISAESIQKCLETKRRRYGDENGNLSHSLETKLKISESAKQSGVGKWMEGRKLSDDIKLKISNANKGHTTSDETREKIGNANSGNNNGMYGKTHKDFMSDEKYADFLTKLSIGGKNRWLNLSEDDKEEWIDRLKENRKHMILPVKDTKIEVKIKQFLEKISIEFLQHKYINDIQHGYQCDFFIPKFNLIIECDGDYWHKYPDYREIDLIRTDEMRKRGYKVLRLWEREIKKLDIFNFQKILQQHLEEDPHYYTKLKKMESGFKK